MKMQAPAGATSVSFEGNNYEVTGGIITVPDAATLALMSHGYTALEAPTDSDTIAAFEQSTRQANLEQQIRSTQAELDAARRDAATAKEAGDLLRVNTAFAVIQTLESRLISAQDAQAKMRAIHLQ